MGNVKGSKSADDARRLLISYEPASGGPATSAVARDAALGGLFIETASPLAIGTLLSVEMKSPRSGAVSVTLEARVFSVRTTEESKAQKQPAGMAVRFLDLPTSAISTLQSILDHHRPPARTQLGVGDEKEALWAAAGGRDDEQAHASTTTTREEDAAGVLALAASVVVDGRPTFDPLPPSPAPGHDEARERAAEPRPPRHPTPRMVPISPVSTRGAPDPASAPSLPYPAPSTPGGYVPPASHGLEKKRTATTGILVATVIAFVILAVVVVVIVSRL